MQHALYFFDVQIAPRLKGEGIVRKRAFVVAHILSPKLHQRQASELHWKRLQENDSHETAATEKLKSLTHALASASAASSFREDTPALTPTAAINDAEAFSQECKI